MFEMAGDRGLASLLADSAGHVAGAGGDGLRMVAGSPANVALLEVLIKTTPLAAPFYLSSGGAVLSRSAAFDDQRADARRPLGTEPTRRSLGPPMTCGAAAPPVSLCEVHL